MSHGHPPLPRSPALTRRAALGLAAGLLLPRRAWADDAEAALDRAAAHHREELDDLAVTRGIHPLAAARRGGRASRWLPEALATQYEAGTAVLVYDLGPEGLQTWLVLESGIAAWARPGARLAEVTDAVESLRGTGRGGGPVRGLRSVGGRSRNVAAATELLLPTAIRGHLAAVQHLIVVPTGPLGSVPFAALEPGPAGVPLAETTSTSIAPSLFDVAQVTRLERRDREVPRAATGPALVVGAPTALGPDASFAPLPGAAREAAEVARRMGVEALTGRAPTRAAVEAKMRGASLLYFATHGVADPDDPVDGSYLLLAGDDPGQTRLTARAIQTMSLSASLAVLSACETGLGAAHDAGIIGLARAFQLAGVRNVVMSLWSVSDEVTAELMPNFLERFWPPSSWEGPAEALRQASLDIRRAHPDPRDWAAFVVFGTRP